MLTRYQSTFHQYTDHTILHTMNVTNFCNHLIGDQVECLTADDIYVLLMGCLFHDVGMGISKEDYELFKLRLKNPSPSQEFAEVIRSSHNELSAMYLEKYWKLLDIPNESYLFGIMQVCKGHRKTDLMNEENYPATYQVGEGRSICLPYLAAILRLSDELDIAGDRNISFIYDIDKIKDPIGHLEHSKHQAVQRVEMDEHTITLHAQSDDFCVQRAVESLCKKVGETLCYCRMVVDARTKFVITQQDVRLSMNK